MPALAICPYPDCQQLFPLPEGASAQGVLCPRCRRPSGPPAGLGSATEDPGQARTRDLPLQTPAREGLAAEETRPLPAAPERGATLTVPGQPGSAITLDLSGPTPALANAADPAANGTNNKGSDPTRQPPGAPSAEGPLRPSQQTLPERIGRFRIVRFLGEGGFGQVYEAHDPQLDRRIALKIAHPDKFHDERRIRFLLSEARAAANLRHPHIVAVFDSGQDGPHYYIASAFIAGRSLAQQLHSLPAGQHPPFARSAALVRQVAEALSYAHRRGVIHRDVKPANIMIDEDDQPLLMDFGLASRHDLGRAGGEEQESQEALALGTPAYMAPEQGLGQAEAASDQYSLGCTLYELLTGQTPFGGPGELQLFLHRTRTPPSPCQVNLAISRDLEAICLKCLHKEPARRYAGCQDLADDLRRFLDDEPIRTRRRGPVERWVRWAQEKPYQALFAGVSVLLLMTGLFAAVSWARYKEQELRQVLQQTQLSAGARQLMKEGKWAQAQVQLQDALDALESRSDPQDEALHAELQRDLDETRRHIGEDENRRQAVARYGAIRKPYEDAWFYHTLSAGLKPAENRKRTLASVRAALTPYALGYDPGEAGGTGDILALDRAYLEKEEAAQLAGACYELLLIWAELEASTLPGQPDNREQAAGRAARALALLERAGRVGQTFGLDTQTFHLRKAGYLAQQRRERFDPSQPVADGPREPTGAMDWFLRGMDRYRAGDLEQASDACTEALRRQEGHFWAHYLRGLCLLQASRWLEARLDLTVCVNRTNQEWPLLQRGFATSELGNQIHQGSDPRAVQLAGMIVAAPLQPWRSLAILPATAGLVAVLQKRGVKEFADARADFDRVLAMKNLDQQSLYVALVNRGALLIRQEHWDDAIADLTRAVKLQPTHYMAYINLSRALQGAGRAAAGVAVLDEAIKHEPDLALLYQVRAIGYLALGDQLAAQADLERSADRAVGDSNPVQAANTLFELGRLLHRGGSYAKALKCYEQALKVRPGMVVVERFRAETLLDLDRFVEAGEALDRYLERTRDPAPEVLLARGLIHARAGELEAAINLYSAQLLRQPDDFVTRSALGWAYLQTDALRLALTAFDTGLRRQPTNADFLVGRGLARIRLKQLAGALADAESARNQGKLSDRLLYNLARLYAQAASQVEMEARANGERFSPQRAGQYLDRAVRDLESALEALPKERRISFWRKQVRIDPLLAPIRQERTYLLLEARYGPAGDL